MPPVSASFVMMRDQTGSYSVRLALSVCSKPCRSCKCYGLAPAMPDDDVYPDWGEDEFYFRMCAKCSNCPSSFCNGYCLSVSYDEFCREGHTTTCSACTLTLRGSQLFAVCRICQMDTGFFCRDCATGRDEE